MPFDAEQPIAGRATDEVCERLDETHHRVDGRELSLPMQIADAALILNVFDVDASAAQRLLEGTGCSAARILPGRSALMLMGVVYRDNPLGDYNEVAVLLSAYPPGTKRSWLGGAMSSLLMRVPYFVYRMPVDQEFTTHAGRFLWGYPKYLAQIEIGFEGKTARARLSQDGEHVLSFEAPAVADAQQARPSGASLSDREGINLTLRNGQLRSVGATLGGTGLSLRLGGKPPELGDRDPLAQTLRELGLPKRPLVSASMARTRMRFGIPTLL